MKTILNIIIILLVAAAVAGGFYLAVNNTTVIDSAQQGEHRPAMTSTDGTRPEGMPERGRGEHSASIGQGLAGIGGSLVKLTVIVSIVLLIQKLISRVSAKRLPSMNT